MEETSNHWGFPKGMQQIGTNQVGGQEKLDLNSFRNFVLPNGGPAPQKEKNLRGQGTLSFPGKSGDHLFNRVFPEIAKEPQGNRLPPQKKKKKNQGVFSLGI